MSVVLMSSSSHDGHDDDDGLISPGHCNRRRLVGRRSSFRFRSFRQHMTTLVLVCVAIILHPSCTTVVRSQEDENIQGGGGQGTATNASSTSTSSSVSNTATTNATASTTNATSNPSGSAKNATSTSTAGSSSVDKSSGSSSSSATTTGTGTSCLPLSLKIPDTVTSRTSNKIVIAHRGASFHVPEHTLAGYRLALELGADYIEPDLVSTSDGHLIGIHSVDLNITTNVAEVFSDDSDRPWFSPYANRTGYWAFNFTLEEIQRLKVKQRVGPARTTRYDDQFQIPTLHDILRELNRWNTVDLPYILGYTNDTSQPVVTDTKGSHPSPLELKQAGIYFEFKDVEWHKKEAGLDVIELLFNHFLTYTSDWQPLQKCYKDVPYDQYKVPPVVVQCFDPAALQYFHETWQNTTELHAVMAEPSYIVLTNYPTCISDDFWFDIGDKYRSFLNGVGCEKSCLIENTVQDGDVGDAFIDKAKEYNLQIHAWTERPEHEYIKLSSSESMSSQLSISGEAENNKNRNNNNLVDVLQETQYLFCEKHVSAVFSESVNIAVLAGTLPCSTNTTTATIDEGGGEEENEPGDDVDDESSSSSTTSTQEASEESSSMNILYVGLGCFIAGGLTMGALILYCTYGSRNTANHGSMRRKPTTATSTVDEDDHDLAFDAEFT